MGIEDEEEEPYVILRDGRKVYLARMAHMMGDYPLEREDFENSYGYKQLPKEEQVRVSHYFDGHSQWPYIVGDDDPAPDVA